MIWSAQADHTISNFLKAVFNNFYLVHSWIHCLSVLPHTTWYIISPQYSTQRIYYFKGVWRLWGFCLVVYSDFTEHHLGQSIQEWTKWNLWKTVFKNFTWSIVEYFVLFLSRCWQNRVFSTWQTMNITLSVFYGFHKIRTLFFILKQNSALKETA